MLGVSFVNVVKTVFSQIKLMISGAVLPAREAYNSWFKAGASAISIG